MKPLALFVAMLIVFFALINFIEAKIDTVPRPVEVKYGTPYKPPEPTGLKSEEIYNEIRDKSQAKTEEAFEIFFAPLTQDPDALEKHDKYFSKILEDLRGGIERMISW